MDVQQTVTVQSHGIDSEIPGQQIRRQTAAAQRHALVAAPETDAHAFAHWTGIGVGGQEIGHGGGKGKIQFNRDAAQQQITHGPAHEVKFHELSMPQPAMGEKLSEYRCGRH